VTKALKALREYSKKISAQDLSKKLLQDEDDSVFVNFTLTEVPKNPTPKPLQITLPHPFNTPKSNARICVFVKDPAREFKD
jgi:hypothetical protein